MNSNIIKTGKLGMAAGIVVAGEFILLDACGGGLSGTYGD